MMLINVCLVFLNASNTHKCTKNENCNVLPFHFQLSACINDANKSVFGVLYTSNTHKCTTD